MPFSSRPSLAEILLWFPMFWNKPACILTSFFVRLAHGFKRISLVPLSCLRFISVLSATFSLRHVYSFAPLNSVSIWALSLRVSHLQSCGLFNVSVAAPITYVFRLWIYVRCTYVYRMYTFVHINIWTMPISPAFVYSSFEKEVYLSVYVNIEGTKQNSRAKKK